MKTGVPYYRVSTGRQGDSGLGLEAQMMAVEKYAAKENFVLTKPFIEIESGRNKKRPVLQEAIDECLHLHGVLLIARLDRLGRNVAFVSALMDADIDFVAVDTPFANKLLIHILAAFAEHERDMISKRTREALAAAKKRGVQLGVHGKNILAAENKKAADAFAVKMTPVIKQLYKKGYKTVRQMTEQLNKRKVAPYRGSRHRWHIQTVQNLLKRIEQMKKIKPNKLNL